MFWKQYPYINLNDLNLDFLLKTIGEMQNEVKNFVTLNAVKYADPIQWDITSQYEKNTIVIDPLTGTAYISVQPVPSGVALNRTDYWTPVFDLSRFITQGNENLTEHVEASGVVYSTFALNAGDWVIWNGILYKALVNMPIGTAYSVDGNIERVTVEDYIKDIFTAIANEVQAREDADTTIINTMNTTIGDLDDLTTTNKTNIVNAINEINGTTLAGQIFHSPKEYGAIGDGVIDDTQAVQNCIDNNSYVVFDGSFYITSRITLHSNLFIMGNGGIVNPSETTSLFGDSIDNVIIKDISFINGERSSSFGAEANIYISNSTNIIIDSIKDYAHNKKACVLFDTVSNFEVRNCIIKDSGYSAIMCPGNCHYGNVHHNNIIVDNYTNYNNTYGIAMSFYPSDESAPTDRSNECTHIIIDSNIIETSLGHWEGIDCHGGQYIDIVNNTIKGFYDGITLTYGNYSSLNVAPKNIKISGNLVYGPAALSSTRTDCYGISCFGNANSGELNITISNNMIKDVYALVSGSGVGNGIFVRGLGITISDNELFGQFKYAIHLNNLGRAVISNNVGNNVNGSFIAIDNITQSTRIDDNIGHRILNFYELVDATGISNVQRSGNKMNGGYWMNNEFDVTDVSVFVPDYCKASPVGSAYHPLNAVALKAIPTSGAPQGWVATGSTWLAMSNLT